MIRNQNVESEMVVSNVPAITRISVKAPTIDINSQTIDVTSTPGTAASVHLADKLLGDILVATSVTFCAAPFLSIVDKAIVQSAVGSHTLLQSGFESIKGMVRNPVQYVKSPTFLLMWGVYAATYSTANSLKTLVEHQEYTQATQRNASSKSVQNAGLGKVGIFLGTTFVNSASSLLKDRTYARMFGTNSVKSSMPRMTYALWMTRDLTVVGSAFILPDLVSGKIADAYGMDEKKALNLCQLTLPIATQFVAGPLHFMGLDLYNRNLDTKTWGEAIVDRSRSLYRGFASVVTARIARIVPGYGVGGVFNTRFRDAWRDHLIQREVQSMMSSPQKISASRLVALLHGKAKNPSS
jgi:hypothetical protein